MPERALISLKDVRAGYGSGSGYSEVLRGITCDIKPGTRIGLLGENGSGKTTLLKVLAGLIPYSGSLTLNGSELKRMKRSDIAGSLSMLSQFSDAPFSYRVWETVLLGRYIRSSFYMGRPSPLDMDIVMRCLNELDIAELKDRRITELSGGQLQRVFLAKTLAQETPVLLLDEPTNHLDLRIQLMLEEKLKKWSAASPENTLIGVFHDVGMALSISDTLLVLKGGRLKAFGDRDAVLASGALNDAYGVDVMAYLKQRAFL